MRLPMFTGWLFVSLSVMGTSYAAECEAPKLPTSGAKATYKRPAGYNENLVRKNVEARFPGAQVSSVNKSPLPGLYEVVVDNSQVIYTNKAASHVLVGSLMEAGSKRNLTQGKLDKLGTVKFETLPLEQSIKFVQGDGSRKLAVFSDPDCSYCRGLEVELAKLNNATIHIFPYPLSIHPDADDKSKQIWCSADPAKAWRDLLIGGKAPTGKGDCANPVAANLAFGEQINIRGTPAIFLANGKRVPGMVPLDKLESLLASTGN